MARPTTRLALVLLALLVAFALKGLLLELPAVRDAPEAGEFDANRAFARLERILAEDQPHGADTPANDTVRSRIVAELRGAGFQPRITDSVTCNTFERARAVNCGRVRNIVATVGPVQGKHLLLVSHYDSSAAAPGASDDGIGIATMIEVAALLRDQPLQRPITFLFNEGEETGLLGARAFLDHDPLASQVELLINLEARGVEGPAIMFETSRPNASAIAAFAAGARRPFANSLSTDFYRLLPNSTDVTVFEERPWTILNFAIIGDETRYHSAGDNLAALDRRSLQHMGREALGIARSYAAADVPAAEGTRIYADFWGLLLVVLPLVASLALLGLLILAAAAFTLKRRALGRPLLAVVTGIIGATLLAFAADYAASLARPADYWRAYPLATHMAIYATALLACAAALLTIGRRADRNQLRAAFWLVFLVLGASICTVASGAAIYFIFPPLAAILGALLSRWLPVAERIGAIIAAILVLATFLEVLALVELLLIDGPYWVLAPFAALCSLPLLIEAKSDRAVERRRLILCPAAGLTAAGWAAALLLPRATEERQQLFAIEYVRDETARSAQWAVTNKSVPLPEAFAAFGRWTLGEVPYSSRRRWTTAAPDLPVAAPRLVPAGERRLPNGRQLAFTVRTSGADAISIKAPPGARLLAAGASENLLPFRGRQTQPYWLRCSGRSCDGMRFDLVVGGTAPVEMELIGTYYRLPDAAQPLLRARPAHSRPQYSPDTTYAIGRARL